MSNFTYFYLIFITIVQFISFGAFMAKLGEKRTGFYEPSHLIYCLIFALLDVVAVYYY